MHLGVVPLCLLEQVKVLGPSHHDALRHCVVCQYQPSLLFYETMAQASPASSPSPSASPVRPKAPEAVVRMNGGLAQA